MRIRPPDPAADFQDALALVQACDRAIYGDSDWTAAELREEWRGLDLARDAWVAEHEGRLAGLMHLYDQRGGRMLADGYVHPELTGRGAGSRLLQAAEERALDRTGTVPTDVRATIETAHLVGDPRAPRLLACRGYAHVRTFHRMVIDLDGELPEPVFPDELELRPFDPERDAHALHAALDEAFAEEWGYEPRDPAEWRERVLDVEQFDPSLFLVLWDGDEIAAASVNYAKRLGDWGFIAMLGVRLPWRRRGLGLALLRKSFRRFAERGETTAALGVDSQNPTGARGLYERAGMRVLWRADVWRKELRPGAELGAPYERARMHVMRDSDTWERTA
jgi:GNAT superfamily N-acetyltransferase